jgi:hypothetical protein
MFWTSRQTNVHSIDRHSYSAIGVPASADRPRPRAAADSAKASTRLSALILAAGQLKTVPGIEKKLKAELDNTVGVKR